MKKTSLLIGRGTIAVNCLSVLNEQNELPKIIICDSKDDGTDSWSLSLFKKATELGFIENKNLFRQTRVNKPDFIEKLKKIAPDIDIIFSIQPYAIFRMPFISLAKMYVVNLHFAPLPKLRGVVPCSWAFIDKLKTMGVTLHLIQDEGVDNGPIIFQKLFPITEKDTAFTLYEKCVENGTQLFSDSLDNILTKHIDPKEQEASQVTYHPMNEFPFDKQELTTNMTVVEGIAFAKARIFPIFQTPFVTINGEKIHFDKIDKYTSEEKISKPKKVGENYIIPLQDGSVQIHPVQ